MLSARQFNLFLCFVVKISAISYNQPKFFSNSSWNINGTTISNISSTGTYPYGIFINKNNTIYILNQSNGQIIIQYEHNAMSTRIISTNLTNSSSLSVKNEDEIYLDTFYSLGGVSKMVINSSTAITPISRMTFCQQCSDIFIDINRTIYCTLTQSHQIIAKSLINDWNYLTTVAGTGTPDSTATTLRNPLGIFADTSINLYVADCGNDRIQLFLFGEFTGMTVAGSGSLNQTISLSCPTSLILDDDNYLFIVDSNNHRVVRQYLNSFQCIIGCSNSSGFAFSQLLQPWSIQFDSYGNVFITDNGNKRILKFDLLINNVASVTTTLSVNTTTATSTTTTSTTKPWCTTPVTFDNIPGQTSTIGVVPNNYKSLNWNNTYYLNVSTVPLSGYTKVLGSSPYVATNQGGGVVRISSVNGTSFSFDSVLIVAAWRDNLNWSIYLYRLGVLQVSGSFILDTKNSTTVTCGSCTNIDMLIMTATGGTPVNGLAQNGTEFGFNDLCVSLGY
ncbi:unnamed protein product [Adineta ricciae]|uniref:NHL repeat containing protein n=2 Tax=Adineta ricciae TaxID=249248 RepID=A0A813PE03_ADIRI|nr:unnamed protein product [Adineta ricciae]